MGSLEGHPCVMRGWLGALVGASPMPGGVLTARQRSPGVAGRPSEDCRLPCAS